MRQALKERVHAGKLVKTARSSRHRQRGAISTLRKAVAALCPSVNGLAAKLQTTRNNFAHHARNAVPGPLRRERVARAPPRGTRRPEGSAPGTHQDGRVGRHSPAHGAGEECHQLGPPVSHSAHGLMQCRALATPWRFVAGLGRTLLMHKPEEPGAQHARAAALIRCCTVMSCRHGAAVLLR